MIIKKLLQIIINLILGAIGNIPSLDSSVITYLSTGLSYIPNGIDLLAAFITKTAMDFISVCLVFLLALHAVYISYSVIMWFVAKIPTMSGK